MRRSLAIVAAVGTLVGLGSPAGADASRPTFHSSAAGRDSGSSGDDQGHYRHHDRYKGNYYDYPDYHGDPYSDDGPYDGYYDCRPTKGPRHSDMWCDHYYGRHE
jgi:hypothetical protein